ARAARARAPSAPARHDRVRESAAAAPGERDAAPRRDRRRYALPHRRVPAPRRARRARRHLDARAARDPAPAPARHHRADAGLARRRAVHGDRRPLRARGESVRGARPPSDRGHPRRRARDRRDDRLLPARRSGVIRPAVVLGTNLAIGVAALGWLLVRHGAPALHMLGAHVEPAMLVGFACAATLAFLAYTRRWQILLAGLGSARELAALGPIRAAGHSVSALVPSAKLGGDPVRALFLVRGEVPGADAIASVAIDRVLEIG